jgi:hypothetical protein
MSDDLEELGYRQPDDELKKLAAQWAEENAYLVQRHLEAAAADMALHIFATFDDGEWRAYDLPALTWLSGQWDVPIEISITPTGFVSAMRRAIERDADCPGAHLELEETLQHVAAWRAAIDEVEAIGQRQRAHLQATRGPY